MNDIVLFMLLIVLVPLAMFLVGFGITWLSGLWIDE